MITYYKLLDMLNRKGMTREELRVQAGITTNAIKAINNNDPVSLKVIDKICNVLKCQPGDIIEWIEKQS